MPSRFNLQSIERTTIDFSYSSATVDHRLIRVCVSSRKRARMCRVIESIRAFKEPFRKKQGGNITQELVAFFSSLCLRSREYFCIVPYFPIITRTSKASPFFCALTKRNFTLSLLGLSRLCSIGTF